MTAPSTVNHLAQAARAGQDAVIRAAQRGVEAAQHYTRAATEDAARKGR